MSRAPLLLKSQASLQSSLEKIDLLKLSLDLLKHRVLSRDSCDKFSTLDPNSDHLEQEVKVRYLLLHVYDRVREDDAVYDKLIKVLSKHGVKMKSLSTESAGILEQTVDSEGAVEDTQLVQQDVPYLVEILVSGSYLWDAIGIALNLPKHKREDCGEGKENVNRLSNILTTWILGSYEGARPATLSSLREALASETVGLGKLAQKLTTYKGYVSSLIPITKKTRLNLDICYQSCDTVVSEDNSTLLEVQVNCSGSLSYQWSKDGEPLHDGPDFSGVYTNILYINKACQYTEGSYSCCISRGIEIIHSDKVSLRVMYSEEKKQLLEFYSLTESEVPQDSWPPVGNSTFINLVLIRQKALGRCDYYTVRGDMDDIIESKEIAEYEEVFREYREGALVLVEGRPGSGKTTLVHKLTRDWAVGEKILVGAKLVFLVTLRLLNASGRDKSLLDLIQIFYDEGKSIECDLRKSRGKKVCFILDGLDEYPIESKKNLIIDQLLFTKTFLPHSMVIVASRPVATKVLKTICKTRVEVVGFSKDQIFSYVKSYSFHDCSSSMAYKMIDFLNRHPNVLHMCYLPIHASMICFLFSQLEGNIPHRETQIYEQFTIATLLKHKTRKGEDPLLRSLEYLTGEEKKLFSSICKLAFDMIVNSQQIVSKSDAQVSPFIDSVLELLTIERTSKYYGSEDFYSFSHLTFQEYLAAFYIHETQLEGEEFIEKDRFKNVWRFYSGLVKSTTHIAFVKTIFDAPGFEFLYKIQCAYESQQVELCDYVIEDEVVDVCETVGYIITSIDFIALGYVISKSTKLVTGIALEDCKWDSDGIESFISQLKSIKLHSIKFLKVFVKNDVEFKALNNLLAHLSSLEKLDISDIELGESKIDYLISDITLPHLKVLKLSIPLTLCSHPHEVLRKLAFGSNCLQEVYYSVHKDININHVVWSEILHCAFGCQIRNASWLHLCNLKECGIPFVHERLSHCTEVVFVNCCIGDEGAEILANTLNTSVLENLVLDFNRIGDSGAIALAGCLARCSVVKVVSIECNSIGDSGATALADALVHCSSLRRLDLQGNSLGDKGAVAIAKATKQLPNLDLYLHNVSVTEGGTEEVFEHNKRARVRKMVFTSSWDSVCKADVDTLKSALWCGHLPALKLYSSNISNIEALMAEQCFNNVTGIECEYTSIAEETLPTLCCIVNSLPTLNSIECVFNDYMNSASAQNVSDSLKTCTLLRSLTLHGHDFSLKLHSSLLDTVKYCPQLQSLSIFHGDFGSFGVGLLFNNYESWVNLHTLKLCYSSIDSNGAHVLSKLLIHCKKLQCLDLLSNITCGGIGDRGTLDIAEGLKNHTSLLELDLGYNDITSVGVAALSQVIKCNHLQYLGLGDNKLGSGCVSDLMNVMDGSALHTLNLSGCQLDVDGIANLSVGLEKCIHIVKLDIHSNGIGSNEVTCLSEGLQHCKNLHELDLSQNDITSDGVAALCRIISSCTSLRRLLLSGNNVGVNGAAVLVSEWRHITILELFLYYCFGEPHESALESGDRCCNDCDNLLKLYYNHDYVYIPNIPKLISISPELLRV